jgi:hypothetical protein
MHIWVQGAHELNGILERLSQSGQNPHVRYALAGSKKKGSAAADRCSPCDAISLFASHLEN